MKQLCIFLVLSLFAGLIHAAVMHVDSFRMKSDTILNFSQDKVEHPCDEMASYSNNAQGKSDTAIFHVCHSDSYQCCLGLLNLSLLNLDFSTLFRNILAANSLSLALQPIISSIFKPPKI